MKILLCSAICLFAVTLFAETPVEGVGRYQISAGKIDLLLTTSAVGTQNTVFRIDTVTGETWYADRTVRTGPKGRNIYEISWILIANP